MNENTQVQRRTTRRLQTLDVQLNSTRLTQATVFHNLCRDQHEISAPPLVCARSGYLHTICSDVTQRKAFHHYISDCHLTILGRAFTQIDRIDRAAVHTILADLIPAIPHHSQQGSTQSRGRLDNASWASAHSNTRPRTDYR